MLLVGTIKAGLWQRLAGWSFSTPLPSASQSRTLAYSLRFSDALVSLHWLRSPDRVMFKVAVLLFNATHGSAPTYLSRLVRVADLPGRCRFLRSTRSNCLLVPSIRLSILLAAGHSLLPAGLSGTICRTLRLQLLLLSTFRQQL